jgi:hypothetical protein
MRKDSIALILYLKHVHPDIYEQTYNFSNGGLSRLCLTGCMAYQ